MNRDSHHESTTRAYRLECRLNTQIPGDSRMVAGEIVTREWREITQYRKGDSPPEDQVTYHTAIASAHAFLSDSRWTQVQFRLVAYELKTRQDCKYLGIVDMPVIENREFPTPGILPEEKPDEHG